jgi:hypothetical protein
MSELLRSSVLPLKVSEYGHLGVTGERLGRFQILLTCIQASFRYMGKSCFLPELA